MGNGMRMKKKNNLKRCLTMENEEFDEHIDLRNSIKHKTKKFSQFIIPDVISLLPPSSIAPFPFSLLPPIIIIHPTSFFSLSLFLLLNII